MKVRLSLDLSEDGFDPVLSQSLSRSLLERLPLAAQDAAALETGLAALLRALAAEAPEPCRRIVLEIKGGQVSLAVQEGEEAPSSGHEAAELALLYEASGLLARTLDPDVIYDTMHDLVARVMDCDTLLVSIHDPDDNLIRCAYAWVEGARVDGSQFPPIPLAQDGRGLQSRVITSGQPLRVSDAQAATRTLHSVHYVSPDGTVDETPSADPMETRSLLLVPIKLEGRVLGVAQVMSHRLDAYTDAHLRVFEALMAQVAAANRNAYLYQQQRRVLREILSAVTEGRLRLCDKPADLPPPLEPAGRKITLSATSLAHFRGEVARVARAQGLSEERRFDLVTSVGEAAMNAVVHANGGRAQVFSGAAGLIQIRISDHGKGIAEEKLHRATLEPGYTTAGTMGYGFWLMLKTVDRIWLLTGPTGTTIVLEQERETPDPFWMRERDFPALEEDIPPELLAKANIPLTGEPPSS